MIIKRITNFDFVLFFSFLILLIIGISFIYSSGINSDGLLVSTEYIKQIIWASTGLILFFIFMLFDLRRIADRTLIVYVLSMVILLYTCLFGRYVNGARSWIGIGIFGIQPSEFVKLIFILYLSHYFDTTQNHHSEFKRFIMSVLILIIPVFLILIQPDLGTATVFFPIFLFVAFVAQIPLRYINMVFFTAICTAILTILPLWEKNIYQGTIALLKIITDQKMVLVTFITLGVITIVSMIGQIIFKKKYYYWIAYVFGILTISVFGAYAAEKVLKEYQIMRLIVFLNPNIDPLGSGWNIIQSTTAIGSGGLWGLGYLKGTQSHYRFLPQQSTDFIFSILSEEWGFIGGTVVFVLYFLIFYRGIAIAKKTENIFFRYVATGIIAMFFYHFVINVGMVMGIMPITGIPLLLLSYGGSSTWTAMISLGILMSINLRRLEH